MNWIIVVSRFSVHSDFPEQSCKGQYCSTVKTTLFLYLWIIRQFLEANKQILESVSEGRTQYLTSLAEVLLEKVGLAC